MNAVYVMVFGAAMSLGFSGTLDTSYKAFQRDGVAAAVSTFVESTREVLRSQDLDAREREAYRAARK